MVLQPVKCPICNGIDVNKHGNTRNDKNRFIGKDQDCENKTFIQDYSTIRVFTRNEVKIIEMALNSCGIRDMARVLGISPATVINELKKTPICTP